MKLKKKIPVIDQGDKLGFWGGKFGGNFVPETLKKPIEDLEILFNKLKKDKVNLNKDFWVFTGSSVGVVPILGKGIYTGKIDKLGSVKAIIS